MRVSLTGAWLIKSSEGVRLEAYQDSAGVWTIGYGHTAYVKPGQVIAAAEAETLLAEDLKNFEVGVSRLVKVPLNQNQFDALVSFAFNLGLGALSSSNLLRLLNSGFYEKAAEEFGRWVYVGDQKLPGLVARREKEKQLFLKPGETAPPSQSASSGTDAPALPKPSPQGAQKPLWKIISPPDNWRNPVEFPGEALDAMKALCDRNGVKRNVNGEQRKFYAGTVATAPAMVGQLTEHFSLAEFACKDGTAVPDHLIPNARKVAGVLEKLREKLGGVRLVINSAYRTPAHNSRVGGEPNSYHLTAEAADIWSPDLEEKVGTRAMVAAIIAAARSLSEVHGLGVNYTDFVHVDVRNQPGRAEW